MRLVLPIPPAWQHRAVDDGVLYQAPSEVYGMLVTPLAAAPEDPETWVQRAFFHRARPEDGEPRNLQLSRFASVAGWGIVLLDGALGTQARFVAYLAFLDYAATVIGMCRDYTAHPGWRDELLDIVVRAQPDFADDRVVCLAHQLGAPPTSSPARKRRVLAGWQRSSSGGDLVLAGEGGAPAGTIRISPGAGPIRPVAELFRGFLEPSAAQTIEPLVLDTTDDGEHLALANAHGPDGQHTLGVVFGDDQYTRIEGRVTDPAQFARFRGAVHELTYATTLGLGAGRWRRFYYEPPPGWNGVARRRGAMWISPACPRHYQVMRVFDARPPAEHQHLHGARMFETLPVEFFREAPKGPVSYWTADELECQVTVYSAQLPTRTAPVKVLDGIIMTDAYVYPIRMECDPERLEDSMHVFERVVASLRPLPERRASIEAEVSAMAFWVD